MIDLGQIEGAAYDVDDTLLHCQHDPVNGLHERTRLIAVHALGKKLGHDYDNLHARNFIDSMIYMLARH